MEAGEHNLVSPSEKKESPSLNTTLCGEESDILMKLHISKKTQESHNMDLPIKKKPPYVVKKVTY